MTVSTTIDDTGVKAAALIQSRFKWDTFYLGMARYVSSISKDPSTQTGAVIVGPDKEVISVGFNGFPASMPDHPELYADREEKYSRIIHCEVNALNFARMGVPNGSTLYTWPFLSCDRCVVQMLQTKIMRYVAPRPNEDQLTRWGAAFEKTKKYIQECGGEWLEYPKDLIGNTRI